MIDIENLVYDRLSTAIKTAHTTVQTSSEYLDAPSSFPFVSIVEADNSVYRKTQTTDGKERHAETMFDINVYSNKKSGRKAEAKKIANTIDTNMESYGFTRITKLATPNADDSIYRITLRYQGVVAKETSGTTTTFYVYGK